MKIKHFSLYTKLNNNNKLITLFPVKTDLQQSAELLGYNTIFASYIHVLEL